MAAHSLLKLYKKKCLEINEHTEILIGRDVLFLRNWSQMDNITVRKLAKVSQILRDSRYLRSSPRNNVAYLRWWQRVISREDQPLRKCKNSGFELKTGAGSGN